MSTSPADVCEELGIRLANLGLGHLADNPQGLIDALDQVMVIRRPITFDNAITLAKAAPDKGNYALDIWEVDDVLEEARRYHKRITRKQAEEILAQVERKMDANEGINWCVIRCHIDMYLESKN